jgi:hypothetical protein
MPALQVRFALALAALLVAASPAVAAERFEKVWCLRYAEAHDAPLSALLAGAPRDATLDLPFAMCVARSPNQVVVLDTGFLDQKLGESFGDVLAAVQLNWQGRVLLVNGDVEGVVPGVDVYLTPGHTKGTMTVCLDTIKGRISGSPSTPTKPWSRSRRSAGSCAAES